MSIFSSLRRSRQSAKEHNAKVAAQKQSEAAAAPYKHVPKHAAHDAMSSAPPSWREADRDRVVEQNKRRSVMTANGHNMSTPSMPRVASSLSNVSYPRGNVSPHGMVPLPRTFSYNSVQANYPSRDFYSVPDPVDAYRPSSVKGKEPVRGHRSSRHSSPSSSKGEISPEGSSGDSVASQDDLEMRPSRNHDRQQESSTSRMHRLAPGNRRRSLDAATDERPPLPHTSSSRGPRPPPSIRGFNSIPASAAPPPPFGKLPGPLPQFSHSSAKRTSGSVMPPVSSPLASAPVTPALELGFDFGDFSMASQSKPHAHTSEYGARSSSLAGKPHDAHQYHEEPSYFAQEHTDYQNESQYQIASSPPTLDRRRGSFPMQPSHAVPRSQEPMAQPMEHEERKSKKLTKAPSKTKKGRFSWSRPPSASA